LRSAALEYTFVVLLLVIIPTTPSSPLCLNLYPQSSLQCTQAALS